MDCMERSRAILSAQHCHGFNNDFASRNTEMKSLSVIRMSVDKREILTTINREDNIKVASICTVKFQRALYVHVQKYFL